MGATLASMSAVIAANDVNLSILKPHWLTDHGILRPDELQNQILVSPTLVDIGTPLFGFSAFVNRLQMTFPAEAVDATCHIDRVLGGLVRLLPHTPYTAVGLNFDYTFVPEDGDINAWTKARFTSPFSETVLRSGVEDARFGSYLSFATGDFRLKLSVHPKRNEFVPLVQPAPLPLPLPQDFVSFNFNFHAAVPNANMADFVLARLSEWNAVAAKAAEIAAIA